MCFFGNRFPGSRYKLNPNANPYEPLFEMEKVTVLIFDFDMPKIVLSVPSASVRR
jgi:hypothetical protein